MRRSVRGVSLAEILVTMFLVSLALGAIAVMTSEYAQITRSTNSRDLAVASAQSAVERVKGELASAIEVSSPAPDSYAPTSVLTFKRLDPTISTRLPDAIPSCQPATWDPHPANATMTVTYSVCRQALIRDVIMADGSRLKLPVASGISGFSVRNTLEGLLQVEASFADDRIVRTLSTTVSLRVYP